MSSVICKNCSVGCLLTIENGIVTGNRCSRGLDYAKYSQELTFFNTKIAVNNSQISHVAVRSNYKISESTKEELRKELDKIVLEAPINAGDVVASVHGIKFIALRRVNKK